MFVRVWFPESVPCITVFDMFVTVPCLAVFHFVVTVPCLAVFRFFFLFRPSNYLIVLLCFRDVLGMCHSDAQFASSLWHISSFVVGVVAHFANFVPNLFILVSSVSLILPGRWFTHSAHSVSSMTHIVFGWGLNPSCQCFIFDVSHHAWSGGFTHSAHLII